MIIKNEMVASIEYTLTNNDGEILDSSQGKGPLVYIQGKQNLIPGLEKELEGKKIGDKFVANIAPEDAYGIHREEMIQSVPKENFAGVADIQIGMEFQAQGPSGVQIIKVVAVDGDEIKIDANHPLAGVPLNFDVEVIEVREATDEEKTAGHIAPDKCGDNCGCSTKQEGGCEGHGGKGHPDGNNQGDGCGCSH